MLRMRLAATHKLITIQLDPTLCTEWRDKTSNFNRGCAPSQNQTISVMGRRNEHSREQLQEMAVTAADEIIASEGLRGLTARKVAGRLGYSAGSLYMVFDGLDDLILHVNARTLERLAHSLDAQLLKRLFAILLSLVATKMVWDTIVG